MLGDFCMSSFFVPYGLGVICNALKAYLESIVFPIPNTNEAIPGRSMGIEEVKVSYVAKATDVIWIAIIFKGVYYFSYKQEMELVEAHLDELLEGWVKCTDFEKNAIQYGCHAKQLTELGNFLRMGGYIIAK